MAFFGPEFHRNQGHRMAKLPEFQARDGREWDPFDKMNEEFYAALSNNGTRYADAADNWLRTICGVTSLEQCERGRTVR